MHAEHAGHAELAQPSAARLLQHGLVPAGIVGVGEVADAADGREDVGKMNLAFIPGHACPVGAVVDVHLQHAAQAAQVLFVQPHAGGAGDALDDERRIAPVFAVRVHEALLYLGVVVDARLAQKIGHQFARRLRPRAAVAVIAGQAPVDNGLRHRLAAAAAQGARLAVDGHPVIRAAGDRLTAMKTLICVNSRGGGGGRKRVGGHGGSL